ncbi:MAG: DUF4339 domain-containing protein [Planctomycetia bacterium]|nr:DUF4339 domain-containing protein [Planctomycetia bacterium]
MAVHWFYKLGNQEIGPLTSQQLKQLADEKRLNPGDPVRRDTDERWVPASSVKGLFAEVPSVPVGGVVPVGEVKIPVGEVKGLPVGAVKATPVVAVVEEKAVPVGKVPEKSGKSEKPKSIDSGVAGIDLGFAPSETSPLRPSPHRAGKGGIAKNASAEKETKPLLSKKEQQKQQLLMLIYATCGVLGMAILVLGLVYSGIFSSSEEKEVSGEKVAETEASRALAATQEVPEGDIFATQKENTEKSEEENAEDSSEKVEEKDSAGDSDKKVEGYSDASRVQIRRGDVKLHLARAVIDTLGNFTGKPTKSNTAYLFMDLTVSNMSGSRILDYPAWGVRSKSVVLKDNLGNQYRTVASHLLGGKVPGQVPVATQITGNISDVLVFTAPVPKAEYLLLELPSLDEDEEPYRFLIPETMFRAKPKTKIESPEEKVAVAENSEEEALPDASQIDQGDLKVRRTDDLSLAVDELAEENENAPTEEVVAQPEPEAETPAAEEDGLTEEQREMRKMMEENGLLDSGEAEDVPDLNVKLDPELEAQMKMMEKQQEEERKARLREKNRKAPPKKSRND